MSAAVQFHNQTPVDEAIDFSNAWNIDVHLYGYPSSHEVCMRQDFQQRIRTGDYQVEYRSGPAVPLSGQF